MLSPELLQNVPGQAPSAGAENVVHECETSPTRIFYEMYLTFRIYVLRSTGMIDVVLNVVRSGGALHEHIQGEPSGKQK